MPTDGVSILAPSFDRLGLIAATAQDLAIAWTALGGTIGEPPERVTTLADDQLGRVEPDRLEAAREAARHLSPRPRELTTPSLPQFGPPRATAIGAEAVARHDPRDAESAAARAQLKAAAQTPTPTSTPPARSLDELGDALREAVGDGVLVTPTLPSKPPLWEDLETTDAQLRATGRLTRLCGPVNSSQPRSGFHPPRRAAHRPHHRDRARRRAPPPIAIAFRTIVTKSFPAPALRELEHHVAARRREGAHMAADVGAVPVQTAIDRIGFGRFQKRLLGVCGVTWAADAAEIFIIAFALPKITEDFGLTTFQSSVVVASTFVGMLAGAWFWGTISDRIGRKRGFTITIGIFAVFGFLSAFSPNMAWLCAFRILAGFGLGGAVPLDFSLFAEYLPTRNRGRWLVILESFWGVGTVVAAGLAWILVPTLGWRYLLGSSAVAGALVFWVRLRIPESPRFLAATGRVDEAEAILGQVARENGVPERDVPHIVPPADASDKVEIKRLFEGKLARTTVMLWSTWFFIALAYYGLFSWLPKIFAERGFDVVQTYGYTLLLAAAQLPGYFSAAWLVERWGRKRTFVTYLSIAALCTFVYGTATSLTVLIAAALLMSFFALGAWSSLYAYTPELLPTRMRTTGMGAASGMARVAGVLAPLIGGVLIPVSLGLTLTVYALAFALAALSVAVLGHETRDEALADTVAEEEGERVYGGKRFVRTTEPAERPLTTTR